MSHYYVTPHVPLLCYATSLCSWNPQCISAEASPDVWSSLWLVLHFYSGHLLSKKYNYRFMSTTNTPICLSLVLIMRFHVHILCDHVIVLLDFRRQVQIYIHSAMQSTRHLGNICEWDIAAGKHKWGRFLQQSNYNKFQPRNLIQLQHICKSLNHFSNTHPMFECITCIPSTSWQDRVV